MLRFIDTVSKPIGDVLSNDNS